VELGLDIYFVLKLVNVARGERWINWIATWHLDVRQLRWG
jgi:hypothetical protein